MLCRLLSSCGGVFLLVVTVGSKLAAGVGSQLVAEVLSVVA